MNKEALSVALEALECALPYVQRFGLGVTAQKIEEILTKENEDDKQ